MAHGTTVCAHVALNVLGHVQVRVFSPTVLEHRIDNRVCNLALSLHFGRFGSRLDV